MVGTEGKGGNGWGGRYYGNGMVHVFTQEDHDCYDLERRWAEDKHVPASEWMPEGAETPAE